MENQGCPWQRLLSGKNTPCLQQPLSSPLSPPGKVPQQNVEVGMGSGTAVAPSPKLALRVPSLAAFLLCISSSCILTLAMASACCLLICSSSRRLFSPCSCALISILLRRFSRSITRSASQSRVGMSLRARSVSSRWLWLSWLLQASIRAIQSSKSFSLRRSLSLASRRCSSCASSATYPQSPSPIPAMRTRCSCSRTWVSAVMFCSIRARSFLSRSNYRQRLARISSSRSASAISAFLDSISALYSSIRRRSSSRYSEFPAYWLGGSAQSQFPTSVRSSWSSSCCGVMTPLRSTLAVTVFRVSSYCI